MHGSIDSIDDVLRQKNLALVERNICAITLAKLARIMGYSAGIAEHSDEELKDMNWDKAWCTILVLQLPNGQVTWHLHASEVYMAKNFEKLKHYVYDGHSTQEKYARLTAWADKLESTHRKLHAIFPDET